jgi:hypothetical protein
MAPLCRRLIRIAIGSLSCFIRMDGVPPAGISIERKLAATFAVDVVGYSAPVISESIGIHHTCHSHSSDADAKSIS